MQNKKRKILFVCLGNICRSPAAEEVMRQALAQRPDASDWELDSAGIGAWHTGQLPDQRMRVHARRRGYDLKHHARQVRTEDFEHFDLIVGMDAQNLADLHRLAPSPEAERKIVPMARWVRRLTSRYDHIPDPYYEGSEGFELVLDLLEDATQGLLEEIG